MTNLSRYLLLLTLVYAPWAYGATRPWTIVGLNCLLGVVLVLWIGGAAQRREWPSVPRVVGILALALTLQAWFMVLNAHYEYDTSAHQFIPLSSPFPWAPGSLHRALSFQSAVTLTGMLGMICIVCDLAGDAVWRRRLLLTIAFTGVSIVLLGLAQRFTNASSIFWRSDELGRTFFATYRYHANAGAFMNLIWPIVAVQALLVIVRGAAHWKKTLWVAALVVCLAGVMANTSRAASAVGLMLASVWGGWALWQLWKGRLGYISPATTMVTSLLVAAFIIAVAAMAGLETTMQRWGRIPGELSGQNPRLLTATVCLDMIPEAGWWGFGPGTFQTTFPYFTHHLGSQIRGRWLSAHEDYLQTLIEWGYLGGALWAMMLFGAIFYSLRHALRLRGSSVTSVRMLHAGIVFALLGVLLHAVVDFPLQVGSIQLYVAAMLGLLWGSKHWLMEPARREGSRYAG